MIIKISLVTEAVAVLSRSAYPEGRIFLSCCLVTHPSASDSFSTLALYKFIYLLTYPRHSHPSQTL